MILTAKCGRFKTANFEVLMKLKLLELAGRHLSGEHELQVMKGMMNISNYYPSKVVDEAGPGRITPRDHETGGRPQAKRLNPPPEDLPRPVSSLEQKRDEWNLKKISKNSPLNLVLSKEDVPADLFDFYGFGRAVRFSAGFQQKELEEALVSGLFGLMSMALVDVSILGLESTFDFITTLSQSDALSKRSMKKNLVAKKLLESSLMDQAFFKEAVLMSCKKLVSKQYSASLSKLVDFSTILSKVIRDSRGEFCKVVAVILKILFDYFGLDGSIFVCDRGPGGLLQNTEAVLQAGLGLVLVIVREACQVIIKIGVSSQKSHRPGQAKEETEVAKDMPRPTSNQSSPNLALSPDASPYENSSTQTLGTKLQDFLSKNLGKESLGFSLKKQRTSAAQIANYVQISQSPDQGSSKRLKLKPIQNLSRDILNKSKTNKQFSSKILRQASKNSSMNQSNLKETDSDPFSPSQEDASVARSSAEELTLFAPVSSDWSQPRTPHLRPDQVQLRTQTSVSECEAKSEPFEVHFEASVGVIRIADACPAALPHPVEPCEETKTLTVERCYRVKRYEEDPEITRIINKYRSGSAQTPNRLSEGERSPPNPIGYSGLLDKPLTRLPAVTLNKENVLVSPFTINPGTQPTATPALKNRRFEKTEMLKKICQFSDLIDSNSKKLSYNIRDPDHKVCVTSGSLFPSSGPRPHLSPENQTPQLYSNQTSAGSTLTSPSFTRNYTAFTEATRTIIFGSTAFDSSPTKKIERAQIDSGLSERHQRQRPLLGNYESLPLRAGLNYSYQRQDQTGSLQDRSSDYAGQPGPRIEEFGSAQPRLRTHDSLAYSYQHFSAQPAHGTYNPSTFTYKYK